MHTWYTSKLCHINEVFAIWELFIIIDNSDTDIAYRHKLRVYFPSFGLSCFCFWGKISALSNQNSSHFALLLKVSEYLGLKVRLNVF